LTFNIEFLLPDMASARKSWIEKRDLAREPTVKRLSSDFADMEKGQLMLIPTPGLVDRYIRKIPRGKQGDMKTMRRNLAARYHADVCCPVTSGIFIRIAAEAAWEEYQSGKPLGKITPFWRIIGPQSPAFRKLSFGTSLLLRQRRKEGLDSKAKG
jgi:hypothetical protein